MMTKIKTTVYAARLRKKLAELTKKRPKELDAYHAAVTAWRVELRKWIVANYVKRVDALKPAKSSNRWSRDPMFSPTDFFEGAPNPPEFPSDQQIRDIRNILRHLGITGQVTVNVSTDDVAKLLGGPGDVED